MNRTAGRHSLTDRRRSLLLTALLLLGMLSLPVECTLVAGPHSMFVDAANLAALQHGMQPGASSSDAGVQPRHHHADQAETPHQQDEDSPPLPSPAELAGNSLTAIDVPSVSLPVTASSLTVVGDYVVNILVERPAPGPDRPPP